MTQDNSSSQLDDYSHQTKEQSTSIDFKDETEILPEPDWQNKEHKYRRATLAEKDCNYTAVWQINSQEKLLTEMDKDPNRVLTIILDMRNIYTKYLNQANHANKQCKKIRAITLGLEQEL